jgi:hypothetical protein
LRSLIRQQGHRRSSFLIFAIPFVIYLACLNSVWGTDHPTSIVDLDYAIYANHSFALGKVGEYSPNSVDTFPYHGYFYTASAPGTAVLAYPFVAAGFFLQGGFTIFGWVLLLSETFVALANALAVHVLYRVSRDFFCGERASSIVALCYGFSTISWPYTTYFFQSDVSALFVLLGVYFALDATRPNREGELRILKLVMCGFSLGTALTVDYVTVFLVPLFALYFLAQKGSVFRRAARSASFLAAASVGGILVLLYNLVSFGNPLLSSEQLYLKSPGLLSGFSFFLPLGLFLNSLTPLRGVFLFTPALFAAVKGFYLRLRPSSFDPRFLLLLVLSLGIVIPYSMWYGPTAGPSYGPRYLVPAMPLLLLPVGPLIESGKRKTAFVFFLAYAAGVVINGFGAMTGVVPPDLEWLSSPFLNVAVPDLASGALDTWWVTAAGPYWPLPAGLILAAPILWAAVLLMRRGEPEALRSEPS